MQLYNHLKRALTSILSLPVSQKHKTRRCCSAAPESLQTCEECRLTSAVPFRRCMKRKRRIMLSILISALTLLLIGFYPIPTSSDELCNVWQLVVEMLTSLL